MTIGPISLFDSITSNRAADCELFTFEEFIILMGTYSDESFASKYAAPLLCFTEFKEGRRSKANANQTGMIVLDVDDHLTIDEVDAALEEIGVAALLCSTASHREEQHKFRVFVPLLEIADYDKHVLAWHVVNHVVANGKRT